MRIALAFAFAVNIGVDVDGEIPAADRSANADDGLDRGINMGKVSVEMELVDSETGEQIAAMVDRENLGAGAEIGSVHFSRDEKWAAAQQAFDGWAHRVRDSWIRRTNSRRSMLSGRISLIILTVKNLQSSKWLHALLCGPTQAALRGFLNCPLALNS
ncbi:MAG: DUF3313 family protein [Acidobacteriaceae bacterium]|nr:DUF3313 family protein [Acidobacteriaceae bacterium]MBV9500887.1 DUF3313 family protein [Acidobacteriaceae bacterium]